MKFPCAVNTCCNKRPVNIFIEHVDDKIEVIHGLCDLHLHRRKKHWAPIDATVRCIVASSTTHPPCYGLATRLYYDKTTSELFGYCEKHHKLAKSHGSDKTIRPVNEDEWPVLDVMEA